MARTNVADVKAIIAGCTVEDAIVSDFIDAASAIIDQVFLNDTEISLTLLTEIEKWLAAHMLSVSLCRTTSEEKIGDASQRFTGKWGEGLKSTPYGQMVLTLDVTGKMAKAGKEKMKIYAITSFKE